MISVKKFLNQFDEILLNLQKRHANEEFIHKVKTSLNLCKELKIHELELQTLQQERNILIKQGITAKDKVLSINNKIKLTENNIYSINNILEEILPHIPNFLDPNVPNGISDKDNVEIKRHGKCKVTNKAHYDMNLINNASEMTCSRFIFLKGQIATLERALGNFLINFLINKGFVEVSIPYLLSEKSLFQTGHLPKDKENMFYIPDKNLYLIPTSECVLLNLLAHQTVSITSLPIKYTAFNVNFRKEAGAAGKDTKGLIRLHQFPKVEMVAFTTKEQSEEMFNHFVCNGEEALQLLGLSYRVLNLCGGDLSFNAKKTYDLEVWMSGSNEYREVSSISYCGDFQAFRLNSKYMDQDEKHLLHTLNGTCLGVGRILAAIMENYYDEDENSIHIPKVLIPYMNFSKIKLC